MKLSSQLTPFAWLAAVAAATLAAPFAAAQTQALDQLSLEELTKLKVQSATDREPRDRAIAGAAFVLTQDDIRRAGATSIPQALRLVPGLQVAQVDASRWAISARGFNSRASDRILVLIDGRSLYTPLTGGVFWSVQDTMIEEIDRIEVTRGPGAATSASNAFNAVINIVTKRSSQTGGIVVSSDLAMDASKTAAARIGDAEGPVKWRGFVKYNDGAANENDAGHAINDAWEQVRGGGRAAIAITAKTDLQLNFEAYSGKFGATVFDTNARVQELAITWSTLPTVDISERVDGGFAGARLTHALANGGSLNLDASTQYYDFDSPLLNAHGINGELNLQYAAPRWGRHRMTSGVMIRGAEDAVGDGIWRISRPEIGSWRASAFGQDELGFFDDRLLMTAGAKLEYSAVTGTDFMPSLRIHYTFEGGSSVWGAVSRGARAPALIERYGRVGGGPALAPFTAMNPSPLPIRAEVWGDADMDSEQVTAFEIGARHRFARTLSADVALYYNRYEGLRGVSGLLPILCEPSGTPVLQSPTCLLGSTHLLTPLQMSNVHDAATYGGELLLTYAPVSYWKLVGAYARIAHIHDEPHPGVPEEISLSDLGSRFDPEHQMSLRSSLSLGHGWDVDAQLRYIDALASVPAYLELNFRAAWRPTAHVELALTGSNLLRDRHHEFASNFGELAPVWIGRKVSLQARWMY